MDPDRIADDVRRFFADDPGDAVAVYLFGSVARGTAHAGSDVDVGVLLAEDPPRTLEGLRLDVQSDLELRLGVPVQLIVWDARHGARQLYDAYREWDMSVGRFDGPNSSVWRRSASGWSRGGWGRTCDGRPDPSLNLPD